MSSLRSNVVSIHKWLGIVLGLVWAIQGLTGALLVFHREAQRLAAAPLAAGPLASLDRIAANAAEAAGPGHPIERIRVLDERDDLLGADYTDHHGMPQLIRIEASTGRVLETIARMPVLPGNGTIWRWIYSLHHELLAGENGKYLVAGSGAVLLSSLCLGAWIAWPARGAWLLAFRFGHWRTLAQQLYGWHRALGLGFGLLLVLAPLTGLYIVFEPQVRAVLADLVPHHVKYAPAAIAAPPDVRVSPEQAWRIAHARFPAAKFESLALPRAAAPAYIARLTQADEARVWAGVTYVAVDPGSAAVLDEYDAVRAPLSNRIGDAAWPLHNGELLGLPGRILVMLLGLTLPAFALTGYWSWWAKRARRRVALPASAQQLSQE